MKFNAQEGKTRISRLPDSLKLKKEKKKKKLRKKRKKKKKKRKRKTMLYNYENA